MDAILAALDAAMKEQQKRAEAAQAPAPPAAPRPPLAPRPAAPQQQQSAQPAAHPSAPHAPQHFSGPDLQGMFADGNSLLRAIIAAEVLGPPPALREQHFWNLQPNEPSI